MGTKLTLAVFPRTVVGRKVKNLRLSGLIPGNVFGAKTKSFAVQIAADSFQKTFIQSGETSLIYLEVGDSKKTHPVLIANIQKSPVTDEILHIDFHEVVLTEKVTATIAVETIGESPAVKDQNGILVLAHNQIEVEALPTDLPDKFTVDISTLKEIGDSIQVKSLNYDKQKVTLSLDPDETLVTVKPQEEEKVEVTPVTETPVAPVVEGEAPAPESQTSPVTKAVEPKPTKSE